MIITEQLNHVETSELTSIGYKIKVSPEAFEILFSKLYSDPKSATIRELATNAADALVGKNEPFQVHLPNNLEPFFSIKDNGTGLSEQQITNVYTIFFESDKTDSNELTGCFGLGSKTPFSYTDNFSVISRFNGKKYFYNAFINTKKLPDIAKTGEEDTTESNGFEVSFAVKSDDFYEFCSKANNVLSWFKIKPIVRGNKNFTFDEKIYTFQDPTFGVYTDNHSSSHLVMGNVAYPIGENNLSLNKEEAALLHWGVDLFVKIGDVDVAAGREALNYTTLTKEKLTKTLKNTVVAIKQQIATNLETCPSIWKARQFFWELKKGFCKNFVNETLLYKGQELKHFVELPNTIEFNKNTKKYKKNSVNVVYANSNLVFLNDDNKNTINKVLFYLNTNKIDNAYLVNKIEQGMEVILTSTLPQPPRKITPRIKKDIVKTVLNELVFSNSNNNASFWQTTEIDLTKGGVYVEIAYYKYKHKNDVFKDPVNLVNTLGNLQNLTGQNLKVYGIRSADINKLTANWIEFNKYVKNVVTESLLYNDCVKYSQWDNLAHSRELIQFFDEKFLPHSPFGNFVVTIQQVKTGFDNKKVPYFIALLNWLDIKIPEEETNKINDAFKELYEKYPLLQHIIGQWGIDRKEIFDYINLIDKQNYF